MILSPARTATIFAAGLSVYVTPTMAQEATGEDEIVVTAQRQNESGVRQGGNAGVLGDKPAEDLPFSLRSYNSALILNQQPQTLGQVLENDPTIRTTTGFGIAGELFVVRGFSLFGDDIGYDGLYGIMPRQLVAPELYDSVQVLNGATAFLNGAAPGGSGIGGSVNLIPKRAAGRDINRATLGYTAPGHAGGSFDIGRRSRMGASGEWGIRVNGAARRGDVSVNDEFRSTYVLGGALDYDNGPFRAALDLAYQRVKVAHFRPKLRIGGIIPEAPDASNNFGQPWQYTTLRDVFGQVSVEYDLVPNAMVYAAVGARDGSEVGVYSTPTLIDALAGDVTVSSSYIPRTDNNEAATAGIRARLAAGAINHEINLGGSLNWLTNRNAYEFYALSSGLNNIYDPVELTPSAVVSFAAGDLDDPLPASTARLSSLFLSDTISLWNDRLLFTAGVRLQEIQGKTFNVTTGDQTGKYRESAWTPVVGLVVKPAPGLSLYANRIEALAQGASAPVSGANPGGGTPLPVSNAGEVLPPFVSEQYEVGGKLSLGRVNATVALFQIDRETATLRLHSDQPGFLEFGSFGVQRNRGIELTVAGELTKGLRMIAGGSVIDARMRHTQGGLNEGKKAVGVPRHLLNANAEWDLPFVPALTLTGRVVHTGEQAANAANTLRLDDWTRFDIGARYVMLVQGRPATLRVSVDNVTNANYWASAFDSFRPDLQLATPRTFKASVTIDF